MPKRNKLLRQVAIAGLVSVVVFSRPALASSCNGEPRASPPPLPKKLSGAEIRSLFVGKVVRLDRDHLLDVNNTEFFYPDGSWTALGGRFRDGGKYHIKGGEVCVKNLGPLYCRNVFREGTTYFIEGRTGTAANRNELIPIKGFDPIKE